MTYEELCAWLVKMSQEQPERMKSKAILIVGRSIVIGINYAALLSSQEAKRLDLSEHQVALFGDAAS